VPWSRATPDTCHADSRRERGGMPEPLQVLANLSGSAGKWMHRGACPGIHLYQLAMALAAGVIVFIELLTAWNVAARALISAGCVLATRRHEEEAPVRSLPHQSLPSPRSSPHPSAR
jgi:hypothetical protein